jgi:hypothetical protein
VPPYKSQSINDISNFSAGTQILPSQSHLQLQNQGQNKETVVHSTRPPIQDSASKWMDLIGAVCKALGSQRFRSLSRRFNQWKHSEIGGYIYLSPDIDDDAEQFIMENVKSPEILEVNSNLNEPVLLEDNCDQFHEISQEFIEDNIHDVNIIDQIFNEEIYTDPEKKTFVKKVIAPKVPEITPTQARDLLRKMGLFPDVIKPIFKMNEVRYY